MITTNAIMATVVYNHNAMPITTRIAISKTALPIAFNINTKSTIKYNQK